MVCSKKVRSRENQALSFKIQRCLTFLAFNPLLNQTLLLCGPGRHNRCVHTAGPLSWHLAPTWRLLVEVPFQRRARLPLDPPLWPVPRQRPHTPAGLRCCPRLFLLPPVPKCSSVTHFSISINTLSASPGPLCICSYLPKSHSSVGHTSPRPPDFQKPVPENYYTASPLLEPGWIGFL